MVTLGHHVTKPTWFPRGFPWIPADPAGPVPDQFLLLSPCCRWQQLVEPDSPPTGPAEEEAVPRTLLHGVGLRFGPHTTRTFTSAFMKWISSRIQRSFFMLSFQTKVVMLGSIVFDHFGLESFTMFEPGTLFGNGPLGRQIHWVFWGARALVVPC